VTLLLETSVSVTIPDLVGFIIGGSKERVFGKPAKKGEFDCVGFFS